VRILTSTVTRIQPLRFWPGWRSIHGERGYRDPEFIAIREFQEPTRFTESGNAELEPIQQGSVSLSGNDELSSNLARQSKEGDDFSVARFLRQLSKRLSLCVSTLAKRGKALEKPRDPSDIFHLNGISKVV
jgi:hypothetical protein